MIKGFILSLQFLTRLPIHIPIDFNRENLRKSTFFYPLVGMILGILSFIPYYFLSNYNREIAAFLTVLFIIILTGGLHLDGLADTADGFFSNKDKEKTLEIMKDSRIGAFGVLSLILLILFKYIIISSIKEKTLLILMLSLGNSRLSVLFQIAYKKTARPDGLGRMLNQSQPGPYVLLGSFLYVIFVIFINPYYTIPLISSLVTGKLTALYSKRKIDGLTGDVYGAIIELSEAISLLAFWGVIEWI
ncbi:MAG TPA: adenosylcobinamide-GDP ribazoletransferase [Tissierellaceae bacterium]|nr:adenosylcobinamide-GDP ribazoletransferase [Tissierellaceae bacterium]